MRPLPTCCLLACLVPGCVVEESGPERHGAGVGGILGQSDVELADERPLVPRPELDLGSVSGAYAEFAREAGETLVLLRLVAVRAEQDVVGFASQAVLEQYLLWGSYSPCRWGGDAVSLRPTFGLAFGAADMEFDSPFLAHNAAIVGGFHAGFEAAFGERVVLGASMFAFTGGDPGDTEFNGAELIVSLGLRF